MGWIQIIFWLLTNLPSLIKIISQFMEIIKTLPPGEKNAVRLNLIKAIKNKDTLSVTKIIHGACENGVCKSKEEK